MQKPSNKVRVLLVIIVLIVAGTIAFSARERMLQEKAAREQNALVLALKQSEEQSMLDTDKDGLFDWEETIRLTDPKNPDSDGDGAIDGAEIQAGRNPAIAGPDDALTASVSAEVIYEHYTPGTLSDKWSTNVVGNFLNNVNNPDFTPQAGADLLSQLQSDADALTNATPTYSATQVITFPYDQALVKAYANDVASIDLVYLQRLAQVKTGDPATYLNELAAVYASTAESLMSISVPEPLADVHVQMANNLVAVSNAIVLIGTKSETDPVNALYAIQNYNEAATSQQEIHAMLATYFTDNGIIFGDDEPGSRWTTN